MKLELFVFDLDGTLVDSRKDLVNSVKITLEKFKFPEISDSIIGSYVGTGVKKLLSELMDQKNIQNREEIFSFFDTYYLEHLADETMLYDGILGVIELLKDKKIALLTNKQKKFTTKLLEKLDITHKFAGIWGGDDFSNPKPSPEPLLFITKHLGISLTDTVMIGDSIQDLEAGNNAKTHTCAVFYGYGEKNTLLKYRPTITVENPREMIYAFKNSL